MAFKQEFIDVKSDGLLAELANYKKEGWSLTQACVAQALPDGYALLYSLEMENKGPNVPDMRSLRVNVAREEPVESVCGIYGYAFLYENEMRDLFGVNIVNMTVDFGGKLYETAVKTPFAAPVIKTVEGEH